MANRRYRCAQPPANGFDPYRGQGMLPEALNGGISSVFVVKTLRHNLVKLAFIAEHAC
jgi:hypothetical protein